MVRKVAAIVFALLFLFNSISYAGDIPESIMRGEQQALFIGKIVAINEKTYSIQPSDIMMGSIEESQIEVLKFENYYGTEEKPKVGDFIVAVLLKKGKVDDLWTFKATSDDYKTLKLVSEKHNMVVRYQKYINDGKYFEAQEKLNYEENTKNQSKPVAQEASVVAKDGDEPFFPKNIFMILLVLVFSGLFIGSIIKGKK